MNKPKMLSSVFTGPTRIAVLLLIIFASPWLKSEPAVFDGEFIAETVPDQKPGEYRVWVNDWNGGLYSRAMLFNASEGEMLGSIETGWEGVKLDIPSKGQFAYNLGLYMSRGYHGERTDVLEYYDRKTLNLEGEIVVPPKAPRGIPSTNHSDFSDDERFLFVSFFFNLSLRVRTWRPLAVDSTNSPVFSAGQNPYVFTAVPIILPERLDTAANVRTRLPGIGISISIEA